MNISYIYFSIFFCIAYLIITDNSVASAFYYLLSLVKFNFEKHKWWLLNNPQNPVVKWLIWRRSYKLAKELKKEFDKIK